MLFLLKRRWPTAILGLVVLVGLAVGLRRFSPNPPPLRLDTTVARAGLLGFLALLLSDALLHGSLLLAFGPSYRRRHRELIEIFRGQSWQAMLAGAAMAGIGEELLFRGLDASPSVLASGAVVFGLLHHMRASTWPFTLWAVWQGLLLSGLLLVTGELAAAMLAHFLHDLAGFAIFRQQRGE
jgi:membrane protease YdiL (CAAX protease family)